MLGGLAGETVASYLSSPSEHGNKAKETAVLDVLEVGVDSWGGAVRVCEFVHERI